MLKVILTVNLIISIISHPCIYLTLLSCNTPPTQRDTKINPNDSAQILSAFFEHDRLSKLEIGKLVFKLEGHKKYFTAEVHARTTHPIHSDTIVLHKSSTTGLYQLNVPLSTCYKIILPDKTKVWLNAGTKLEFPAKMEESRQVQLTGEGYFEVTKLEKPLYIQLHGSWVEVGAGKINVNCYNDTVYNIATVVTGKVTLHTSTNKRRVSGGTCVRWSGDNSIRLYECDPEDAFSWTIGFFSQDKTEDYFQLIERINRWYAVKIVYKGEVAFSFDGKLPASARLKDLLAVFKANNIGHSFVIENKELKIILTPIK